MFSRVNFVNTYSASTTSNLLLFQNLATTHLPLLHSFLHMFVVINQQILEFGMSELLVREGNEIKNG